MPITSGIINPPASLRSEVITISPESVIIISGIRKDQGFCRQLVQRMWTPSIWGVHLLVVLLVAIVAVNR